MSYLDVHRANSGKVSDKWHLYLSTYSDVFEPYMDKEINYLEIGIQNGGSLDVAASYFRKAKNIVGCDINPSCIKLNFGDPRIKLLIGDANSSAIYDAITDCAATYDIIIDDGSHTSPDIIKSFAKYFPILRNDGIFVIEDLHCSYWKEFQGGLYDPDSSLNFLKLLSDVVNHEHWGINRSRRAHMDPALSRLDISISEESLAEVHSVTFLNSLCIIRKQPVEKNSLGDRVISGTEAQVFPGIFSLNGKSSPLNQADNPWSTITQSPIFEYRDLFEDLQCKGIVLKSLKTHVQRQEDLIRLATEKSKRELEQVADENAQKTKNLVDTIAYYKHEIQKLENSIDEYKETVSNRDLFIKSIVNSTSWKLSAPIRAIQRLFRKVLK